MKVYSESSMKGEMFKISANPSARIFGRMRYIFKLLGFLPFNIEVDGLGYRYVPSRLSFSVLLFLVISMLILIVLGNHRCTITSRFSLGSSLVDSLLFSVRVAVGPLSGVFHLWRHKSLFNFAQKLLEVDDALQSSDSIRRSWELETMFGILVVCIGTPNITKGLRTMSNFPVHIFAVLCMTKLVCVLVQIEFTIALVALRVRFERLNKKLLHVAERKLVKIKYKHSHGHGRSYQPKRLTEASAVQQASTIKVCNLQEFGNIHKSLIDAAVSLNNIFSPLMLIFVVLSFLDSVHVMFVLVEYIVLDYDATVAVVLGMIVVSCFSTIILSFQLIVCRSTYNEARGPAIVCHKVYNKVHDLQTKEEILLLSKQLYNEKVQFTACNLFVLDVPLIYTVLSTISVYVVVMVQFKFQA